MTEYAVIGGTGTIGRLVVGELRAGGAQVRVLSRRSGDYPVDLSSGTGLVHGLRDCQVVIDASNGSPRSPEPVLVDGARRLVQAAADAGVGRIVCVSIVGIEQLPSHYYRAKVAQERIVRAGPVAATIVRSTQFHELVVSVLATFARLRLSPRLKAVLQPVAAAEAARAVAEVACQSQPPDRVSVAGPELADANELARDWREHAGRRLVPVALPLPRRLQAALGSGALTCPAPDVRGELSFRSWLATLGEP